MRYTAVLQLEEPEQQRQQHAGAAAVAPAPSGMRRPAVLATIVLLQLLAVLVVSAVRDAGLLSQAGPAAAEAKRPLRVILDQDGNTDDFIALMVLLAMPQQAQLLGVVVTPADCFGDLGVDTTLKLLRYLNHSSVRIGLSTLPAANPFPDGYRAEGLTVDVLPQLNGPGTDVAALRKAQLVKQPGQEWLAQLLLQQREPVHLLVTGPLSNLAYVLKKYPAAASKVAHLWWMGGSLRAGGNVMKGTTRTPNDGSGEWNAFWDPAAVGTVFASAIPITLVPLDATNKVPITVDLVTSLGSHAAYPYSQLLGNMWSHTVTWIYKSPTDPYCAWDTLAAACMLDDSLCKIEQGIQAQAVTSGLSQGALRLVSSGSSSNSSSTSSSGSSVSKLTGSNSSAGVLSPVKVLNAAVDVSPAAFQKFLLKIFKQ